jgi:hypothetical protein
VASWIPFRQKNRAHPFESYYQPQRALGARKMLDNVTG